MMDENRRAELVRGFFRTATAASNEEARKIALLALLRELFPAVREMFEDLVLGLERQVRGIIRSGRKSERGAADALYGTVIIEFEHDMGRTGAHAAEQLRDYLAGSWNTSLRNTPFTLIATDTLEWRIYAPSAETLLLPPGSLRAEDMVLELQETFRVDPAHPDDFYFFLDRRIFRQEVVPATMAAIRQEFGAGSEMFAQALSALGDAWKEIAGTPKAANAYEQWARLLSFAYGRFDATERVFVTQAYLGILARLVAWHVLEPGDRATPLEDILSGEAFSRRGIRCFTDEDFFRWTFSALPGHSGLRNAVRGMLLRLERFDFGDVREDILKGVYQELVDDDTRHGLGEYYTPDWLCEEIVREIDPGPGERILDPACGSGSFLRAAANHLIAANPDITPEELNDQLHGIDVHPLSVQIARATMVIALGGLKTRPTRTISPNIFLANSLLLPRSEAQLTGRSYAVRIDRETVRIPAALMRDGPAFRALVDVCDRVSRLGAKDPEQALRPQVPEGRLKDAVRLCAALTRAREAGRDGIWAYILNNAYVPVFLRGGMDVILGNPPWLTLGGVVDASYKDDLKRLARDGGILPGDSHLHVQLDLAAIFLVQGVRHFLRRDGRLAFVMPRSVFTSEAHAPLRLGGAKDVRVTAIWDVERTKNPFRIPSCVIFAGWGAGGAESIPGRTVPGGAGMDVRLTRLNGLSAWTPGGGDAAEIRGTNPYARRFQNGANLFPRAFFFVEMLRPFGMEAQRIRSRENPAAKEPWSGIRLAGAAERRFLFLSALAENIAPFAMRGMQPVVLPVTENGGCLDVLSADQLINGGWMDAGAWFRQAEELWERLRTEKNAGTPLHAYLDARRKLSSQSFRGRYLVVYTASAKRANACVIDRERTELPFVVENAAYHVSLKDGDEAGYLCAFLNSDRVAELVAPFQSRGAFGARHVHSKILEIPLPAFNPRDGRHAELAGLAWRMAETAEAAAAAMPEKAGIAAVRLGIRKAIRGEMARADAILEELWRHPAG